MQTQKKELSKLPFLLLLVLISVGFSFTFVYSSILDWEKEIYNDTEQLNELLNQRCSVIELQLRHVYKLDEDKKLSYNPDMFLIFERIGEEPLKNVEEVVLLEQYYAEFSGEVKKVEDIAKNGQYNYYTNLLETLDYSLLENYNQGVRAFNEKISSYPYKLVARITRVKHKQFITISN